MKGLWAVLVLYNAVHSMCASKWLAHSEQSADCREGGQTAPAYALACDMGELELQLAVVQCGSLSMLIGCKWSNHAGW